jgi:hypothetical protein
MNTKKFWLWRRLFYKRYRFNLPLNSQYNTRFLEVGNINISKLKKNPAVKHEHTGNTLMGFPVKISNDNSIPELKEGDIVIGEPLVK